MKKIELARRVLSAAWLSSAVAMTGCQGGAGAPAADDTPAEVQVLQEEQVRHQYSETDRLVVPVDGHPSVGPVDAPVTLVYSTSFTCPFCARSRVTLQQLEREYGDKLRVVTRLRLIGPEPLPPALAACAAERQGRFHEYADLLWERAAIDGGDFSQKHLASLAREAGLDMDRFQADAAGEVCADTLAMEDQALLDLGLRGAPSWVINGRVIVGAQPIEKFREVIDDELAQVQPG